MKRIKSKKNLEGYDIYARRLLYYSGRHVPCRGKEKWLSGSIASENSYYSTKITKIVVARARAHASCRPDRKRQTLAPVKERAKRENLRRDRPTGYRTPRPTKGFHYMYTHVYINIYIYPRSVGFPHKWVNRRFSGSARAVPRKGQFFSNNPIQDNTRDDCIIFTLKKKERTKERKKKRSGTDLNVFVQYAHKPRSRSIVTRNNA